MLAGVAWIPCRDQVSETDHSHHFQEAHGTDLMPLLWLQDKPLSLTNFSAVMTADSEGHNHLLDVIPFEKELTSDLKPETPLSVVVGGNSGHQYVASKKILPVVSFCKIYDQS